MNKYSYVIRRGDNMKRELEDDGVCKTVFVHKDVVENVKSKLLDDDEAFDLSEFFKVFGDGTRIKIIQALSLAELCVCDICTLLGMSQSAISHQLKFLRQAKLVKVRKDGKSVYYSLDDDHIDKIFNMGLAHIREE